ncbi:hypothetical protein PLICRDRAFT_68345, partial [Plicaturopsis crispa FD-325 SS-3]
ECPRTTTVSLAPQIVKGELVFGAVRIPPLTTYALMSLISPQGGLCFTGALSFSPRNRCADCSHGYARRSDQRPRFREVGINALHVKLRASGGTSLKSPGPGTRGTCFRWRARAGRIEGCHP